MGDEVATTVPLGGWEPSTMVVSGEQKLAIRFTGSGSEYFRIWIVNLLLTIVTLGVYFPWAKVRRLRYFYGNTLVGEHPLGFHADPKKMLRGYVLVSLLFGLYSVANHFSPVAGVIALLIVAGIWPALIKSSLQFRLANTSWRGLRFRFRGTTAGAYKALLPLWAPALLILAVVAFGPEGAQTSESSPAAEPPLWFALAFFGVMLAALAAVPLLWWMLKKYQHDGYAYGPERATLKCGPGAFYGVFMKTSGVSMLSFMVLGTVGGLVMALMAGGAALFGGTPGGGRSLGTAMVAGIVIFVVMMVFAQLLPRPYFVSRMQNLLWWQTESRSVAFRSGLRFRPLLGLTVKNWLLMLLTLGLYWPFAAVASHRMRVEAVTVELAIDPQLLIDSGRALEGEAAGDAAGDLFGIDIGL